jgi:hypothetical protein
MSKHKFTIFLILLLLGIVTTINLFTKNVVSQEEFFNDLVENSFRESYSGIVKKKYYLREGGRDVIVLLKDGLKTRLDYIHEKQNLYEFIEVGDTVIKKNGSNSIIIKRSELDTTIYFKFDNVKSSELYSKNNKFLNK